MKKNNIILIGFMGVGKGTIARALFNKSGKFSVDTDDLIESISKLKVKDIFKIHGETHFRALEKQCALWLENSLDNTIISTGGGFYKQENIKNIGQIIYLKSSFDGILNRINAAPNAQAKLKKRPLLQNLEEAQKLYNQRIKEYENVSDFIVDVELKPTSEIVKEILEKTKG